MKETIQQIPSLWKRMRRIIRYYAYIFDDVDTESAAQRIKSGIWFRGPNVWILAFAIVLASVGLNVNSTAVIIGAMLVSPLMGPIIGMGLSPDNRWASVGGPGAGSAPWAHTEPCAGAGTCT